MQLIDILKLKWRAPTESELMGYNGLGPHGVVAEAPGGLWLLCPDDGQLEFHTDEGEFTIYEVNINYICTERPRF